MVIIIQCGDYACLVNLLVLIFNGLRFNFFFCVAYDIHIWRKSGILWWKCAKHLGGLTSSKVSFFVCNYVYIDVILAIKDGAS